MTQQRSPAGSSRHAGGGLQHTHSPRWMQLLLDRLAADHGRRPDLVVADVGWAGCAARRGIDTVCFADWDDPALFTAEADGVIRVRRPDRGRLPVRLRWADEPLPGCPCRRPGRDRRSAWSGRGS